MKTIEIPLTPEPQTFSITFGTKTYRLRFAYTKWPEAGWLLDISDDQGNALVCGIPLVTGLNLLAPYAYLDIPALLYVVNKKDPFMPPEFNNLGTDVKLYAVVPS